MRTSALPAARALPLGELRTLLSRHCRPHSAHAAAWAGYLRGKQLNGRRRPARSLRAPRS